MKDREIVIVGDVHGCLDELDELLKTIQYNKELIRLIFLGDLIDRGPDSLGVLRRVQELGCECILGNHCEKHIRFRGHEERRKAKGTPNPMKGFKEKKLKEHFSYTDADIQWMIKLPLILHIENSWHAIHGGLEPNKKLAEQQPNQIIRARYINAEGKAVALRHDKTQPENSTYWSELWSGPESIIYGHCVHSLVDPRIDKRPNDVQCIGIDTGCVYGGRLTGYFLRDNKFVQVQAKQEYYPITPD